MDAYRLWVRNNRDLLRFLESTANWAMWILPERFGNSEVAAEAAYALLGVVTCVNQHVLKDSFPRGPVVSILREAEAVVEVAAQRFVGDDRKWGFLAVTEALKACVRFAAFGESGYSRMLLQGGEVENAEAKAIRGKSNGSVPNGRHSRNGHETLEVAAGAATAVSQNGEMMEVEKPTWATAWSSNGLSRRLFMLGEAVHILRPLVYVLMVTKFGTRSWTPWLMSLALDVTSLGIHSHRRHGLSCAEGDEFKRRKMMIWIPYAVRDPFFATYTRCHLQNAQKVLNPVPLIGLGKLVDLSEGVQSRYTYTSGS